MGVAYKASSAFNPRSNACAESAVRLNKLLQKKNGCNDDELEEFIMRSNCLFRPDGTGSPAEVFFRRNMRVTGIPRATVREVDFLRLQLLREEAAAIRRGRDDSKHYSMNLKKIIM